MKQLAIACFAACLSSFAVGSGPALALDSDPQMGSIEFVGFNFCPRGTLEAKGQLLRIADQQAMFSLFGTQYGGDGINTFGLPDLSKEMASDYGRYCVVLYGIYPSRP